ncbi:enoyl-CoA hydratase/isomerase family protein [Sphingobium aromaticiconvertens]|uniref:enoyl-CoA hydratase/isomerase family protein n=1 Tax=Sphingobium aromaticiconvertens TaxID=365341 RepID=UPI0030158985
MISPPCLMIDPRDLTLPWMQGDASMGVVDLDAARGDENDVLVLPPFPLIGIGNPSHPLAPRMDVLVESPVTLESLTAAIMAQRPAALVLVQLLRAIEGMDMQAALVAESMAYGLLQGSEGHGRWLAGQSPAPPMPAGRVLMERDGDRLDIILDRAVADNAIDRPMRDGLREAFELAALDPEIERIMLRSEGRAFSLGADLAEFGTTRDPATAHAIRMHTLPAQAIARCCDRLTAHVQGACVGSGLEMAAFAGRITASPSAWFHLPELAMGVMPGAGGCVSVSRRIGRQRAALMILSGKRISARTALGWGLIDAIMDD